jgi:hypothetical protein
LDNYTQFSINNLEQVITTLKNELNIDPFTALLHNLEFEVNLILSFDPNSFIDNVIAHKSNSFNFMDVKNRYGKQTLRLSSQYGLKIFNKSLQFNTDHYILRYEIKCLKMELIRKTPVYLPDLLMPAIVDRCKNC